MTSLDHRSYRTDDMIICRFIVKFYGFLRRHLKIVINTYNLNSFRQILQNHSVSGSAVSMYLQGYINYSNVFNFRHVCRKTPERFVVQPTTSATFRNIVADSPSIVLRTSTKSILNLATMARRTVIEDFAGLERISVNFYGEKRARAVTISVI